MQYHSQTIVPSMLRSEEEISDFIETSFKSPIGLITYEVDNVDQVKHKNAREVGATTGSNLGSFPQGGMSDSRSASETGRATHVGVHKYKIMDRDGGVGGPFLFMEAPVDNDVVDGEDGQDDDGDENPPDTGSGS